MLNYTLRNIIFNRKVLKTIVFSTVFGEKPLFFVEKSVETVKTCD